MGKIIILNKLFNVSSLNDCSIPCSQSGDTDTDSIPICQPGVIHNNISKTYS